MEAKTLPVSSLNDMVFEGRNKAYGAYALRQNYNRELSKAAGISFSSVLLLFGLCNVWVHLNPPVENDFVNLSDNNKINEVILEPYIPKPLIPEPANPTPAIAKSAAAAPALATREFREIKIVSDQTPVTDLIPSQRDFTQAEPGLLTGAGEAPGTVTPEYPEGGGAGSETNGETNNLFVVVEQMPEFPEGLSAMYKFINKHLRYPPQAQAQGLEGAVVLTFVVSASGQISDIEVLQDIGGGAAEEAKRVIRKMPDWRPGKQNKRAVPVRFTLPIKFKLN